MRQEEATDSDTDDDERNSPAEVENRATMLEKKFKRHRELLQKFTDSENLDDAHKWMTRLNKFEEKHLLVGPEYRVIGELLNRLKMAEGKDKFLIQQKLNRAMRMAEWKEAFDPNNPANYGLIQREQQSSDFVESSAFEKEKLSLDGSDEDADMGFDDMKERDGILIEKLNAIDKVLEAKLADLDHTFGRRGKALEEEIKDLAEERNALTEKKRRPMYRKGFDVKLIDINRTCKVTKGGQVVKYSAILVCGNYQGAVGFAKAKGPGLPLALQKVCLWPASTRSGMSTGKTVQTILSLAGFKNVKSKVIGSRNPYNTVKAVFQALNKNETRKDVEEKFGRTVVESYLLEKILDFFLLKKMATRTSSGSRKIGELDLCEALLGFAEDRSRTISSYFPFDDTLTEMNCNEYLEQRAAISLKQPAGLCDGPVKCFIKRDISSSTYRLFLCLTPGEHACTEPENGKFLLCAKRHRGFTGTEYVISTDPEKISRSSNAYVGKSRSNFLGSKFIICDTQSPLSSVSRSPPGRTSRRCYSKKVSPEAHAGTYDVAQVTYELSISPKFGPRRMHIKIEDLAEITSSTQEKTRQPLILRNITPKWIEKLQSWGLNFQGRVTLPSVKNFQLRLAAAPSSSPQLAAPPSEQASAAPAAASGEQGKVILQFGKVGKDVFTMDYRYPLSAFQAFAICLTSFDTKILCE